MSEETRCYNCSDLLTDKEEIKTGLCSYCGHVFCKECLALSPNLLTSEPWTHYGNNVMIDVCKECYEQYAKDNLDED